MIYYLDHNFFESDENNFFDEGVLSMRYHDIIGLSWETGVSQSNNSKEYIVCHYWYFNHE